MPPVVIPYISRRGAGLGYVLAHPGVCGCLDSARPVPAERGSTASQSRPPFVVSRGGARRAGGGTLGSRPATRGVLESVITLLVRRAAAGRPARCRRSARRERWPRG